MRRATKIGVPTAVVANKDGCPARIPNLFDQDRFVVALIAACTKVMLWFSVIHAFLQRVGEASGAHLGKLVAALICIPCFKTSHFFFKVAYRLSQRRLLRICGENLLLEIHHRPIPRGSVVDVLEGLRHIKCGLDRAKTAKGFNYNHFAPPNKEAFTACFLFLSFVRPSIGKALALDALQNSIGTHLVVDPKPDAIVKAELKFCHVALQMLGFALVVRANHSAFEGAREILGSGSGSDRQSRPTRGDR